MLLLIPEQGFLDHPQKADMIKQTKQHVCSLQKPLSALFKCFCSETNQFCCDDEVER